MKQSKHQYYSKGVDIGRADITFDFRRVDANKIKQWSPETKKEALEWFNKYVEPLFSIWASDIRKQLK